MTSDTRCTSPQMQISGESESDIRIICNTSCVGHFTISYKVYLKFVFETQILIFRL